MPYAFCAWGIVFSFKVPHKTNNHKLEKALKIVDPPNLTKHKLVSKAAILYGGQKESQR